MEQGADFGRCEGASLLTARWVVAHDAQGHRLLADGEVVVIGQRIAFVGHGYRGEVARRLDFGNSLIGPGFIDLDALADLDTTILALDNHPEARTGRVWPRGYVEAGPFEMYSAEELAFQKRYGFAHLLRNGITTAAPIASLFYRAWAETVPEFEAAALAAQALNLRVYLGPAYSSGLAVVEADGRIEVMFDEAKGQAGLAAAIDFAVNWEGAGAGLVRAMLAPNRIETCTPELLSATRHAAERLGCVVRLHACQSHFEYETVSRLRGQGPVAWLDRLGLLGPNLLMPHATHLAPSARIGQAGRDLDLIAESGASVIHCPQVAARFGDVIESFSRYRDRGINIAMGTDTWPPDMIRNMQAALLLGRVADGGPTALRAADLYDAATLGGAKALARDDLGRLAPGACADLTVFDLTRPELGQVIDPIQTMMLAGHGGCFSHVMVDGRFSVIDGQVGDLDLMRMSAEAQAQFDRLVALYPRRSVGHPPVGEIFAPSYPVSGARREFAPWHRPS